MTLAEFARLLEGRGPDLTGWPDEDARAALDLMAASAAAQDLFAAATAEGLAAGDPGVDAAFIEAVLARIATDE
jgi:hypothetical protein